MASEGLPNGVFALISLMSVRPFMAYRPLPPMMPMVGCELLAALFFTVFKAGVPFPVGNYQFRFTGSNSILSSRWWSVAAGTSGSWPKTMIEPSLTMVCNHFRLVSSVCKG